MSTENAETWRYDIERLGPGYITNGRVSLKTWGEACVYLDALEAKAAALDAANEEIKHLKIALDFTEKDWVRVRDERDRLQAALIAAEQALATEVANCAQALVDMNQARLRAEQALREIASDESATYAWCKQRAKEALG